MHLCKICYNTKYSLFVLREILAMSFGFGWTSCQIGLCRRGERFRRRTLNFRIKTFCGHREKSEEEEEEMKTGNLIRTLLILRNARTMETVRVCVCECVSATRVSRRGQHSYGAAALHGIDQ